ncbi:DMT family transporter [Anaerotardibacter muris]|uniref:DMT family transporter n=1 Tax=Anaerotardibacter muris TaxID=2941505 RepID=UPI00203F5AEF|nr:DMT family transporter [Anaerotardibacter muris]
MNKMKDIPVAGYKAMLFFSTIIWGAAFVVMKDAVEILGPAQLVGVRFILAGLILGAVFHKKLRKVLTPGGLRAGITMGIILFVAFWLQTLGLANTTPGKNAFLTATYCVMVPLIVWMISRRFPGWSCIIAAITCVAGIGLVSVAPGTFGIGFGDAATLAGAVVFALEIIFISRFTKIYSAIGITIIQFLCCGVLGLIFGFAFEPMPQIDAIPASFFADLAYLVLLSSCVCYVCQNVGLAHVPPAQGSLILSLESVFGVICSVLFYGEVLTAQMIVGFILIFIAILISELAPRRKRSEQTA